MIDRIDLILAKLSGPFLVKVYGSSPSGFALDTCNECGLSQYSYICVISCDRDTLHVHICEDCYKKIFNESSLPARIC